MRIGKPVNVFALPAVQPQIPALTIANPTPLKTILGDGSQAPLSPLATRLLYDPSVLGFRLQGLVSAPPPPQPPTAQAATAPAPAPTLVARYKDASAWWTGSQAFVHIPQAATHDQVASLLKDIMPANQADSVTDAALKLVHSQGGHAVFIGLTVGGLAAAILAFFGCRKKIIIGVSAALAVLAAGLGFFSGHQESPFAGKWTLNVLESHYEVGTPPREALDQIVAEGDGLKVTHAGVLNNGSRDDRTYQIGADGKGQDANAGVSEARTISADQKRMTVTWTGRTAAGTPYHNVAIYDRK